MPLYAACPRIAEGREQGKGEEGGRDAATPAFPGANQDDDDDDNSGDAAAMVATQIDILVKAPGSEAQHGFVPGRIREGARRGCHLPNCIDRNKAQCSHHAHAPDVATGKWRIMWARFVDENVFSLLGSNASVFGRLRPSP